LQLADGFCQDFERQILGLRPFHHRRAFGPRQTHQMIAMNVRRHHQPANDHPQELLVGIKRIAQIDFVKVPLNSLLAAFEDLGYLRLGIAFGHKNLDT